MTAGEDNHWYNGFHAEQSGGDYHERRPATDATHHPQGALISRASLGPIFLMEPRSGGSPHESG